jgi:hypothetical protein
VKGKALLFFPSDRFGKPDERTMHAGQVCFEAKWIAQLWLRQRAYSPALPPGNSKDLGLQAINHFKLSEV